MVMMYHGTTTKRAVNIAGVGAILSPSEQRLARMRAFYAESSGRTFEEMYPGKTMKEVAIEMAAKGYAERELEHRVKAVSLDKRFHIAEGYASHGDNYPVGGIILGLKTSSPISRPKIIILLGELS